jgi:hypothetical protein
MKMFEYGPFFKLRVCAFGMFRDFIYWFFYFSKLAWVGVSWVCSHSSPLHIQLCIWSELKQVTSRSHNMGLFILAQYITYCKSTRVKVGCNFGNFNKSWNELRPFQSFEYLYIYTERERERFDILLTCSHYQLLDFKKIFIVGFLKQFQIF